MVQDFVRTLKINEDVIATSGLCAHNNVGIGANHFKVTGFTDANSIYDIQPYVYLFYLNPTHRYQISQKGDKDEFKDTYDLSSVDSNGWYYLDNGAFVKCENQSDDAHPYVKVD